MAEAHEKDCCTLAITRRQRHDILNNELICMGYFDDDILLPHERDLINRVHSKRDPEEFHTQL